MSDQINLEVNRPVTSDAYAIALDVDGEPFSITESGQYQVQSNGTGPWSAWTNYEKDELITLSVNDLIRLRICSSVSYNRTKTIKIVSDGVVYYTWNLTTKAGMKPGNIFEYKFSDLTPGVKATPPTGWRTAGSLIGSQANPTISSTLGFYHAGGNALSACWIKNTNMSTSKIIRASIKFTQNSATPSRTIAGAGLVFTDSAQTKLFCVEVQNIDVGLERRLVIKTYSGGIPSQVASDSYKHLPGLTNFILDVLYNPVNGMVQAHVINPSPSSLADKISLTAVLPDHTLLDNVGVLGKNNTHSFDFFELGYSSVPMKKGFEALTLDVMSRSFTGKLHNGFIPKSGSYGGIPLDNIVTTGGNFSANLVSFDDLLGNNINPFFFGYIPSVPWATESYVELLADDSAVYSGGAPSSINYFTNIPTLANPSGGSYDQLGNHITERANIHLVQEPPLLSGASRWRLIFAPSGLITTSVDGTEMPPDQPVTIPVYLFAEGSYLKKFVAEVHGNGALLSFTETTETVSPFFTKHNSPYDTLTTSNNHTVVSGGLLTITSSTGEYSVNGGSFINTPSTVIAGDVIQLRNQSKKLKDRKTITTLTIGAQSFSWTIRTKIDKQYELDLSKPVNETVIEMATYANDIPLADELVIGQVVSTPLETKNTQIVISSKRTNPYQGNVTFYVDRLNLGLFETLDEPEFSVDTLTPTPEIIVAAFNDKYNTNLTVEDFDFNQALPAPDSDGETYSLLPAASNPLYIGELDVTIKTSFLTGKTTELTSGPFIMYTDGAVIEDKLYIPGGRRYTVETGEVNIDELNIYNFTTDTWSTGTSGGITGASPAVWQVNGKMYVLGGSSKDNTLSVYTPGIDSWETKSLSSLPGTVRDGIAVTSIGNYLYYCGGKVGSTNTTALWRYDTVNDVWLQLENCPVALTNSSLVAIGSMLYYATGYTGSATTNSLYGYDTVEDTWTQLASSSVNRQYAGYAVINGKMYLCQGGMGGDMRTKSMEIYDPETNTWDIVPDLGYPLVIHTAVAYQDNIYLYGGRDASGTIFNDLIKIS